MLDCLLRLLVLSVAMMRTASAFSGIDTQKVWIDETKRGDRAAVSETNAPFPKRSGSAYAPPQIRLMQDDENQNPAFLWVDRARAGGHVS